MVIMVRIYIRKSERRMNNREIVIQAVKKVINEVVVLNLFVDKTSFSAWSLVPAILSRS